MDVPIEEKEEMMRNNKLQKLIRKQLIALLLAGAMLSATACEPAEPRKVILPGATEAVSEEVSEVASESLPEVASEAFEVTEIPETEEAGVEMRYATAEVRVRTEASTKSIIAGKLQIGEAVEYVSEEGTWTKVIYNGQECYVASEYLTAENPNAEAAEDSSQTTEGAAADGTVLAAGTAPGGGITNGTPANSNGKVICIDAGHQEKGNSEQEAVGPGSNETKKKVSSGTAGKWSGLNEYELNLTVALKLQTELESRGYTVIMVRTTHDVDISNIERADIANNNNVDAFLRIHADGSEDSSVHGTFTICQTSNSPYNADIYEECLSLAQNIVDGICEQTESKNRGIMQSDNYSGINWSKVPVTIIEMGYMSNKEEDTLLGNDDYQNKIVTGIANGLDKYFASATE